jgi:N6-adenosine-specific RNA methylase IME4
MEVYRIIESMYPHLPKIELFARRRRFGWAEWGNDAELETRGSEGVPPKPRTIR